MTLRGPRTVAIALGLSCVFFGVLIARNRGAPGTAERARRADHLFSTFDIEGVRRLTIQPKDATDPALILERDPRDPETFRLGGKEGRRADAGLVTALLHALAQETVQRRYDVPPADSAASLATPDWELTVESESRTDRVRISREHTYLMAAVVEGEGNPRFMALGLGLEKQLARSERDFTTRSLFPISKSETQELVISRGDGRVVLRPSAFGFAIGEKGTRADRDLVEALFFQVARSELEVVRERASVAAAQKAEGDLVTLEQRGKSGGVSRVTFGGRCGTGEEDGARILALELGGEERAGCVGGAIGAALAIEPKRYIDKRILPLRADEIDHVVLRTPDVSLDLIRKDEAFELTDEGGRHPIDKESGTKFFRALSDAEGTPWEGTPPDAEAGTLRAVGHGTGDLVIDERVLFWKANGAFLCRRGDGALLNLSGLAAGPFEKAKLWLRDRSIVQAGIDSIESLTIKNGPTSRTLERTPEGFRYAPGGDFADARLVEEFLDVLVHLKAKAFLDEAPPASAPSLSLGWMESEKSSLLSIYDRRQGGFRATFSGVSGTFLLDPTIVEKVGRSLENRAPASFNLDEATRVVLEANGPHGTRALELVRRGAELVALFEEEEASSNDIPALLGALSPLWARPEVRRSRTDKPALTIRIEFTGSAEPLELTFLWLPVVPGDGAFVAFSGRSSLAFAFDERAVLRLLSSF